MERGSDKHSGRVDDEMTHEIGAMVQGEPDEGRTEWRSQETPAEGEGGTGAGDRELAEERPPGLGEPDLEEREMLARHLRPSAFPGSGAQLVSVLEEENAPDDVVATARQLPDDRVYMNVQEVWQDLGGAVEHRD